jgi:hypothetical protein
MTLRSTERPNEKMSVPLTCGGTCQDNIGTYRDSIFDRPEQRRGEGVAAIGKHL